MDSPSEMKGEREMRRTWSAFKLINFLMLAFISILSIGNLCGLLGLVEKLLNQFNTPEETTGEQREKTAQNSL